MIWDISGTPAPNFLGELKAVRAVRGGLRSVNRQRVPSLVGLAEQMDSGDGRSGWRPAVRVLLLERIGVVFGDEGAGSAVAHLLGLSPETDGWTTDERRARAASAAGYSRDYFRRGIESSYLDDLVVGLAALQLTEDAEVSVRTAIDGLARGTGAHDARFLQQALDCGLAP